MENTMLDKLSAHWKKEQKQAAIWKYKTKEEAINARKMYLADPENFVRPNQRKSM